METQTRPIETADLIVFANKTLGTIEGPLFGQFLELVDECVNGGIYDPESPNARADGVRLDALEALHELRPTHIRYPGGCAVAHFNWQELVGPPEQRPAAKLFREMGQAQSTAFGIPEAWALCQEVGAQLLLSVNAHTQSPEDAANLVEYLNSTQPTKWANLRREHGREEPYGVKYFGLGNEIYGDWQPGQKTAEEYVAWCREACRQMKYVDSSIDITVVGLGRPGPEWDRKVIQGTLGLADMISCHNYFGRPIFADNMAANLVCQEMIDQLNWNIDEVMDANLDQRKRPDIAMDEWHIWYRFKHGIGYYTPEIYTFSDALAVATLLHTVLRNTKTVKLSNTAQFANILGTVMTDKERCIRQTVFYPMQLLREAHSGGRVVDIVTDGPVFSARHERFFRGIVDVDRVHDADQPSLIQYDDIPAIDALCSIDGNKVTLSIVQKLEDKAIEVRLDWRGVKPGAKARMQVLQSDDLFATNTLDEPFNVVPVESFVEIGSSILLQPATLTVLEMHL